ncbi:ATP-grasp domain-containing protein [Roseovarius spongiae]|uniref:ATP-grasp domain-containing protein n=1 Tax=Roseovarius spongiae TaxID=2320272 RepID=A0A3A8ASU7_9RHOB|nr:ATP-grasp domain-containing protein [Roseovarius spongiae]RKF12418.1 ATP-grasp domain-containing protein [Roseovarius spongiae]
MANQALSVSVGNALRRVRSYLFLVRGMGQLLRRRLDPTVRAQPAVIVLSLGSKGSSARVAAAARARGYRVVVFCAELPFAEARYMDHYHRIDCVTDFDKALETARGYAPEAILLEGKNRLLPMQNNLAQTLGVTAVGNAAVKSSNSKIDLHASLDRAGLANLPWEILPEDGRSKLSFPVVSKPDVGTSSMGVQYLDSLDTFRNDKAYWDKVAQDTDIDGQIMLESYIDGRQFDVEGVARDGAFHILTVVEEYYQNAAPYFPPSWFLFNPPIPEEQRARLEKRVEEALKAFGVTVGGWHCESRFSDEKYGDGSLRPGIAGNEIYVLDYANRMGYNQLVSESCGADFAGAYVDTMLPRPFSPPQITRRSVLQIMIRDTETLRRAKALAQARPDVVHRGAFVPFEFSAHTYFGHIVLSCPDFETLRDALAAHDLIPDTWAGFYPDAMAGA